jgi:translation elongation factor EF-G
MYMHAQTGSTGGGGTTLNLVVIGHVDAGKSTLVGHMLTQIGFVDQVFHPSIAVCQFPDNV